MLVYRATLLYDDCMVERYAGMSLFKRHFMVMVLIGVVLGSSILSFMAAERVSADCANMEACVSDACGPSGSGACRDAIINCGTGSKTVGNGLNVLTNPFRLGNGSYTDPNNEAYYSSPGVAVGSIDTPNRGPQTCANAYKSCMSTQSNTEACTDSDVLKLITRCNSGNVGADGTGCGTNSAIIDHNQVTNGKNYSSNLMGLVNARNALKDSCNTVSTTQSGTAMNSSGTKTNIAQCKDDMEAAAASCGWGKGGESAFKDCVAGRMTTAIGCAAMGDGYKFTPAPTGTKVGGSAPAATTGSAKGTCEKKSSSDPSGNGGGTTSSNPLSTGFTQAGDLNGDAGQCGEAKTNLITCDCNGQQNTQASGSAKADNSKCSGVQVLAQILKIVLFVLTILVGVAAVGGIAYSAILYASAEDNASNTSKAKEYIRNIVIGLFAYGLMVAIIGWLVPGSVIG